MIEWLMSQHPGLLFMVFGVPSLTYVTMHRVKRVAPTTRLQRRLTDLEVWGCAFLIAYPMALATGVRWVDLAWIDAMLVSVFVGLLTPTIVKLIMKFTKDRPGLKYVYLFLRADRRRRAVNVEQDRRTMKLYDADPDDTWSG